MIIFEKHGTLILDYIFTATQNLSKYLIDLTPAQILHKYYCEPLGTLAEYKGL